MEHFITVILLKQFYPTRFTEWGKNEVVQSIIFWPIVIIVIRFFLFLVRIGMTYVSMVLSRCTNRLVWMVSIISGGADRISIWVRENMLWTEWCGKFSVFLSHRFYTHEPSAIHILLEDDGFPPDLTIFGG